MEGLICWITAKAKIQQMRPSTIRMLALYEEVRQALPDV
jgi:hypothetical protein